MARIAVWEFEGEAAFDGRSTFAEVAPQAGTALRSGTLEFAITPYEVAPGTVLASGAPARDPGSFAITLGAGGSVTLTCSTGGVAPFRAATAEGFAVEGERVQLTLSWGERGRFTAVNLSRLETDRDTRSAGFSADLPLRARLRILPGTLLTFGATPCGLAPYFAGEIHRVTLSDSADAPSVAPPSAAILRLSPHRLPAPGAPRRGAPMAGQQTARPVRPAGALDAIAAARIHVATAEGERPVESLRAGDEVLTRDHGLQPLRGIGTVALDWTALRRRPALRPVVIRRGALGDGLPDADLTLPPEHRVVVVENGAPILRALRSLAGRRGVFEADALGVRYVRLAFDRTECYLANGVWVEAFNPADALFGGQYEAQRAELRALFPDLPEGRPGPRPVPREDDGVAGFRDLDG